LLASVDPVNNKVAMLSIPRDLWVKIPGNGYQKINAAYPDGKMESRAKTESGKDQDGLNLLDQTIEPVLGISIHYHAVVDFKAFKDLVDSLGGVSFNVPEQLYDPTIAWENHNNPVIAKAGIQTMHGQQALLYARSRETSSDFARGQRQRQLLVAIKDKALSLGTFSNPVKVSNLLSSLSNNVYTDFSLNDMERLYQIGSKITSNNISSLDLVTPPHAYLTTAPIDGLSTVIPKAGQGDYSDIQNFVRNELRDGFLAKENASLAVYNATDVAGLATSKAAVLKSYGYSITTVANAAKASNPAKTTVVDLTKNKDIYTRHYLEQRFNTTAVTSVPASAGITPPAGSNFVIILGEDATNSN
jgi:LCP family protein required for cell wall assembly